MEAHAIFPSWNQTKTNSTLNDCKTNILLFPSIDVHSCLYYLYYNERVNKIVLTRLHSIYHTPPIKSNSVTVFLASTVRNLLHLRAEANYAARIRLH
jgi:hypothetical protein